MPRKTKFAKISQDHFELETMNALHSSDYSKGSATGVAGDEDDTVEIGLYDTEANHHYGNALNDETISRGIVGVGSTEFIDSSSEAADMTAINMRPDHHDSSVPETTNYASQLFYYKNEAERFKQRNTWIIGAAAVVLVFACILIGIAAAMGGSSGNDDDGGVQYIYVGDGDGAASQWSGYSASSPHGAVATDERMCSQIGVDVLGKGGNAVDAAVASTLCLGVLSPISSGLGGGCFIVVYNASSGEGTFIDSREVAPTSAHPNMYVADPLLAQNGGSAVAVPAELRGLHLAFNRFGSGALSWNELVEPAAVLADEWEVSPQLHHLMGLSDTLLSRQFEALSELFLDKQGRPKAVGSRIKQPTLAHTLRQIGAQGDSYLYDTMAEELAADIQEAGGFVTADDIRNYEPVVYPALRSSVLGGYTYLGAQGSSSGGPVVAGMLKFMQSYAAPMVSQGALYYHRLVECMKHVFAIRMHLGDPSYVNVTGPVGALLSDAYMAHLQQHLTDDAAVQDSLDSYGGLYHMDRAPTQDGGTSHLSVVDPWGNAVALTSTVNSYFGSKVVSPSTGIVLNNEMDDFSIPNASNYFNLAPFPTNYPEPGKRPLSSMSPSVLLNRDGAVWLVGGASGGPHIITATAQVILNVIGRGMNLLSAVVAPRVHSQLLPDQVNVECKTAEDLAWLPPPVDSSSSSRDGQAGRSIEMEEGVYDLLRKTRHRNVSGTASSVGITQFIAVDPDSGSLTAVSDPRKNGIPAGMV